MSFILALMLLAQSSEDPKDVPAPREVAHEESGCTPILQKFQGMQLAEAKIDISSGLLRMVYWRKLSKHQVILWLVVREECTGPYRIVSVHPVDPEPAPCPEGAQCV